MGREMYCIRKGNVEVSPAMVSCTFNGFVPTYLVRVHVCICLYVCACIEIIILCGNSIHRSCLKT